MHAHPVHSTTAHALYHMQDHLQALVTQYGGQYSSSFTPDVTHLVAQSVISEKHKVAARLGIPIVQMSWVEDCVKRFRSVLVEVGASTSSNESTGSPPTRETTALSRPVLENCHVFLQETFSTGERVQLSRMLLQLGATVATQLDRTVTHFIAHPRDNVQSLNPSFAGEIVSTDWVKDCISSNSCVNCTPYRITIQKCSTPVIKNHAVRNEVHMKATVPRLQNMETDIKVAPSATEIVPREPPKTPGITVGVCAPHPSRDKRKKSLAGPRKKTMAHKAAETGMRRMTLADSTQSARGLTMNMGDGLFSGLELSCIGFEDHDLSSIRNEIVNMKGDFIELMDVNTAARSNLYLISPSDRPMPPVEAVGNSRVVTEFWLEKCLEASVEFKENAVVLNELQDQQLYDPTSRLLFRPLNVSLPITDFQNFVIGVSGYEGVERDEVGKLVLALGATFTEVFSRKNTHLIAKACEPPSMKIKKAIEWGTPCISSEWILECAKRGICVDLNNYRTDGKSSIDMSLDEGRACIFENGVDDDDRDDISDQDQCFASTFQPKFDISVAECSQVTPFKDRRGTDKGREVVTNFAAGLGTSIGAEGVSPLHESFAKNLEKANKKMDFSSNREPLKGKAAVFFEHNFWTNYDIQKPKKIFQRSATFVNIIHESNPRRAEFNRMAAKLGAKIILAYQQDCTHFMHQAHSNNNDRFGDNIKELKLARNAGKHIVSPAWLEKCFELNTRLPESDYPHTYHPFKNLTVAPSPMEIPVKDEVDAMDALDRYFPQVQSRPPSPPKSDDQPSIEKSDLGERFLSVVSSLRTAPKGSAEAKRKPIKMPENLKESPTALITANENQNQQAEKVVRTGSIVIYDDPEGRTETKRWIEQLKDERYQKRQKQSGDRSQCREPIFLMTGQPKEERAIIAENIRRLGGRVVETDNWDKSCTHLICHKPQRNEKCLAALATGTWILPSEYITESAKSGYFLNEDNPWWKPTCDMDQMFIKAMAYWRKSLRNFTSSKDNGAFEHWTVLLIMRTQRRANFVRVLRAGKADVYEATLDTMHEFLTRTTVFTHCITDLDIEKTPALAELQKEHRLSVTVANAVGEYLLNCGEFKNN
ncbi:DNA topoisomerase 2-binding protein 1 [Blyttiomyces sp. JEL0837]|nr:DNA topoisomerase 2-binding protein 1 [Blyttiomyces sp. JEL0837]